MEQEDHREVDWHPGQVEQRQHAGRAEEAAAEPEVAQRLHAVGQPAELRLDGTGEAFGGHAGLDPARHALHHRAATELQNRQHPQGEGRQQGEVQQGVQVPRRQDTVEHLHHVDRPRQLQEVHHSGEHARHAEMGAAGTEGGGDGRLARGPGAHGANPAKAGPGPGIQQIMEGDLSHILWIGTEAASRRSGPHNLCWGLLPDR